MIRIQTFLALCCTCLATWCAAPSHAITLQEHGVSLVPTGVIDHVSGLRWLDADLTQGPVENLVPYLEQGWRIATLTDFNFLMSRDDVDPGTAYNFQILPGGGSEGGEFLQHLGFDINDYPSPAYDQPWLCMDFGDLSDCTIDTPSGTPIVFLQNFVSAGAVEWGTYLSKVPLYYGNCFPMDQCVAEGRTMLVRPVPLPGALWLMLVALGCVPAIRRASSTTNLSASPN